jgi:hypothetical protein
VVAEFEDDSIAARPGVSRAGAVGVEKDFLHVVIKSFAIF